MNQNNKLGISVLLDSLHSLGVGFIAQIPLMVIGLVVFLILAFVGRLISRIIVAAGERTRLDIGLARLLSRVASVIISVFGLLVAGVIVFPTFRPGDLVAGLGITSVAIGFAFKDILQNFFAGVLILLRRPFIVGDQIRSGDFEGVVEEINVRSTRIKTYEGERAVLPNGDVYSRAILVRTAYDRRRVKFMVGIGYPDSIEKARAVIHESLNKTDGILQDPEPCVFVTELAASSVNFAVYFWVQSSQANLLKVSDRAITGVKLALDAAQIDMPFPHTVLIFQNEPPAFGDGSHK